MPEKAEPAEHIPLVEMRGIWKRFPSVIANRDVNLEIMPGEVHALLGENGAGKTTLMNILSGLYQADLGEIWINGQKVNIRSPKEAMKLGIGMVHQHFRLVDNLTIAESIHLGWAETPRIVSQEKMAARVKELARLMDFDCDPNLTIRELTIGEQQRVEILKTLSCGARILILDEPTAVLTPSEAEDLFRTLRSMATEGKSIIFISHKLDEVLSVSDRITTLRHGKNIGTLPIDICTARALARLMVGEHVIADEYEKKGFPGKVILELRDVSARDERGLPALVSVNLTIREGEILGIAGVSGNGQVELAEVLTGLRNTERGRIILKGEEGEDWSDKSAAELADAGIGYIPEDRLSMGLLPSLPVFHSAILREYRKDPIRKGIRLMKGPAAGLAVHLVQAGDVRVPNIGVLVRKLSGGNQQKLITQREIKIAKHALIAMQPTRGLDVAATEDVRRKLIQHRNDGVAILLISEDLDEIFQLADRIAVMYEGELSGPFDKSAVSRDEIGLLMGGSR